MRPSEDPNNDVDPFDDDDPLDDTVKRAALPKDDSPPFVTPLLPISHQRRKFTFLRWWDRRFTQAKARIAEAFFEWCELLLFALMERKPIPTQPLIRVTEPVTLPREHADDIPFLVSEKPRECRYCPFGISLVAIAGGWHCSKCFAHYVLCPPQSGPLSLADQPTMKMAPIIPILPLFVEQPTAIISYTPGEKMRAYQHSHQAEQKPFITKYRTGDLMKANKIHLIGATGPINARGLRQLTINGEKVTTGELQRVNTGRLEGQYQSG